VNLDCIVFAQRPKLTPHKEAIRRRIAEILQLDAAQMA
jgi:2-C-methyl-D-erythritol 2,4-cyclodiphosphate synthase/2-C-methyl-D-erythritol 4-phosphate cytidylyltransferase/2-C-methyl-D-erythritol 2,4-cyclodiphosphate synthase